MDEPYTAGVQSPDGLDGDGLLADADAVFTHSGPSGSVIMTDTRFFIATFPSLAVAKSFTQYSEPMACELNGTYPDVPNTSPLGAFGRNATVLQCRLLNSTYLTDFDFEGEKQSVGINLIRSDENEEVPFLNWINGPRLASSCQTQQGSFPPYGCSCVLIRKVLKGNSERSAMTSKPPSLGRWPIRESCKRYQCR